MSRPIHQLQQRARQTNLHNGGVYVIQEQRKAAQRRRLQQQRQLTQRLNDTGIGNTYQSRPPLPIPPSDTSGEMIGSLIVGGLVGFAVAGPIGVVLGGIVGICVGADR